MKNSDFTILVVDDTPELLIIAERMLQKAGFNVLTANNGHECLEVLTKSKPDIILLDVMLPDINGFDLCSQIKSNPETKSAFVILLSGLKTKTNDISEGLELGSDGYITRPLPEREFLARVNATCRIITAERELNVKNTQLEILIAEKDKFFSILAHDLRNPIGNFIGLTDLFKNNAMDFTIGELMNISERMNKSAINLYSLLNNLLEWSMVKRGVMLFEPKVIKLKDLLENIYTNIEELFLSKKINYEMSVDENITITADEKMLRTIIRNLITNAVKFSNENDKVRLTVKQLEDKSVEVCVSDTGIGMGQDILENLFKLNENVKREGTANERSSGLGLILCKEFVELHNGKIWAESEEGKGSKFCFTLNAV
jgi:signal transduction histidine kinase